MSDPTDLTLAVTHLRHALDEVIRDLSHYPGPIAGCDQQYTHLLATRTRIRNALRALDADVFVATPRTLHPGAGVESR